MPNLKRYNKGPYAGLPKSVVLEMRKTEKGRAKLKKLEDQFNAGNKGITPYVARKAVSKPPPPVMNVNFATSEIAKHVSDLVDAILTQDKPYVLPRYAGSYVAPHQFRWQKTLSLTTPQSLTTAFLVTNNPDGLLWIGQPQTGTVTIPGQTNNTQPAHSNTFPVSNVSFDYDLSVSEKFVYKANRIPNPNFMSWDSGSAKWQPNLSYYPGQMTTAPANLFLGFLNDGQAGQIGFVAGTVIGGIPVPVITINPQSLAAGNFLTTNLTGNVNWLNFVAAAGNANSDGFYFSMQFIPTNGNPKQGSKSTMFFEFDPSVALATPVMWNKYALWELMAGGDIAYAQYQKAARYNVTGQRVTFTNTTSELVKGGSIYAARLPGNTYRQLGGTVSSITALISSQVHHVLDSTDLSEGMSYSFTPEKLQDWLFEREIINDPYQGDPQNIPFCAVAIDCTNIISGTPTFTFTGKISIEYLTTDPSNWMVATPAQAVVFDAVLNALALQNCVSGNPSHYEHLKKVVSNVMTSDNVKYAVRSLVQAGVKLAPFILSML